MKDEWSKVKVGGAIIISFSDKFSPSKGTYTQKAVSSAVALSVARRSGAMLQMLTMNEAELFAKNRLKVLKTFTGSENRSIFLFCFKKKSLKIQISFDCLDRLG